MSRRAFTLIELLVVIGIAAVLATPAGFGRRAPPWPSRPPVTGLCKWNREGEG
jgi:prepilin-type N-terminal cleavage/methylation domain-containing protein